MSSRQDKTDDVPEREPNPQDASRFSLPSYGTINADAQQSSKNADQQVIDGRPVPVPAARQRIKSLTNASKQQYTDKDIQTSQPSIAPSTSTQDGASHVQKTIDQLMQRMEMDAASKTNAPHRIHPLAPRRQKIENASADQSDLRRGSEASSSDDNSQLKRLQAQEGASPSTTNSTKNLLPLPEHSKTKRSLSTSGHTRPYPKQVFFIVANEFCERFSFYGLRTVLVLYFRQVYGLSDSTSAVSFHVFAMLCYIMPLLGALLGDSVFGKYRTILYMSMVYFLGELTLVLSSIFWDHGGLSLFATGAGLVLIGVGTGGIKPCVGALGGDQFLAHETERRKAFFSLFYASINIGSLISMFATPVLRSRYTCVGREDCYPFAFGVPCALMFVAILVFVAAKSKYVQSQLPERNVLIAFCQCVWLALRRKIAGHKLPKDGYAANEEQLAIVQNGAKKASSRFSDSTSRSTLSVSSNESMQLDKQRPNNTDAPNVNLATIARDPNNKSTSRREQTRTHWLFLAADCYDTKSIEDFRSVLAILLLFVPIPIYWCLYDQQGSLWTLQATRMHGRLFGDASSFALEPDQMSVANPLLLLMLIPVFECFIYPSLRKVNLLTRPIQRMTTGGVLASLAFIVSALIELRIQQYQPAEMAPPGNASVLLVNGLNECSLMHPVISTNAPQNITLEGTQPQIPEPLMIEFSEQLDALRAKERLVPAFNSSTTKLSFKLAASPSCAYDANSSYALSLPAAASESVRLVYVTQGNGQLSLKTFDESLKLPSPGKARVRLLYESFGSIAASLKRSFRLVLISAQQRNNTLINTTNNSFSLNSPDAKYTFKFQENDGPVMLSDYLEIEVPINSGSMFTLFGETAGPSQSEPILLGAGTRNLIILHQSDAQTYTVRHELLQDNNYRVNIAFQLIPYTIISASEVMFSITGLEFSYSMAPESMKSVILAAWSLTAAFGNMVIVFVESVHLFSNVANDFFFYSFIMALDMVAFAILGVYYIPPLRTISSPSEQVDIDEPFRRQAPDARAVDAQYKLRQTDKQL